MVDRTDSPPLAASADRPRTATEILEAAQPGAAYGKAPEYYFDEASGVWAWGVKPDPAPAPETPPTAPAPATRKVRPLDVQVGGSHYKDMAIQPVEFIANNNIPFLEGNVIKYVCRHAKKGGKDDLLKARHYIDLILQLSAEDRD